MEKLQDIEFPLANVKKADLPATRTIVSTAINMNQGQK